jgi:hypothetical protein
VPKRSSDHCFPIGGSIELTVQVTENGKGKTAADHKATLVLAPGSFSLTDGKRGDCRLAPDRSRQEEARSRQHAPPDRGEAHAVGTGRTGDGRVCTGDLKQPELVLPRSAPRGRRGGR